MIDLRWLCEAIAHRALDDLLRRGADPMEIEAIRYARASVLMVTILRSERDAMRRRLLALGEAW